MNAAPKWSKPDAAGNVTMTCVHGVPHRLTFERHASHDSLTYRTTQTYCTKCLLSVIGEPKVVEGEQSDD